MIHRSVLESSLPISGYYKYSDVFQIFPNEELGFPQSGGYVYIEYNTEYAQKNSNDETTNVDCDDRYQKFLLECRHLDFLKELVGLLTIATNQPYHIYFNRKVDLRPPPQMKIEKFSDVSDYYQIGKESWRVKSFANCGDATVSIHTEADRFFKNYFNLDSEARGACNASIFMYESMRKVWPVSASMAYVGWISSIENILEFERVKSGFEPGECPTCNQKMYKITKRFKDFMLKYAALDIIVPGDQKDTEPSILKKKLKVFEKIYDKIYNKRSKISHAGEILEADRVLSLFTVDEYQQSLEVEAHVRVALFNYLLQYE